MIYGGYIELMGPTPVTVGHCRVLLCGDSGTRVLKSGSFFQSYPKLMYFLGLDSVGHWNLFLPDKEFESSYGLKMVEATRELIFPTLDPFFGWSKTGSGLTRIVGQVRFPSRILFVSERKRFWPFTNFIVVLLTVRSKKTLKNCWKTLCDTADPFCMEQKKDWEASGAKNYYKPPLRSERAFRNTRFAFCVLTVPQKIQKVRLIGILRFLCVAFV